MLPKYASLENAPSVSVLFMLGKLFNLAVFLKGMYIWGHKCVNKQIYLSSAQIYTKT